MKAKIIKMRTVMKNHLCWRWDDRIFVTLCDDGSVILDGRVMSLDKATQIVLERLGAPSSVFWE